MSGEYENRTRAKSKDFGDGLKWTRMIDDMPVGIAGQSGRLNPNNTIIEQLTNFFFHLPKFVCIIT